ncbi:MAG TPA: DUF4838 domain-containing protein [Chthoniobacteraceae bacterium]|nr:DUF4838 domain-containing protein [Chthoniobacteraceae bacterium]
MSLSFLPPFPLWLPTLLCLGLPFASMAQEWDLKPLGEAVEIREESQPRKERALESRRRLFPAEGGPLILAQKGKARALLVLPAKPGSAEHSAAQLLKTTLEAMTGAAFQVCSEARLQLQREEDGTLFALDPDGKRWDHLVWIGRTEQAQKEGITTDNLAPEGYRLVSRKSGLYVVGRDSGARGALRGTYFGVASLLERYLGVRWLWPGEIGTVIPKAPSITLRALNEQDEPALTQRIIRNMPLNARAKTGLAMLHASDADYQEMTRLQGAWLSNQKTGASQVFRAGHAYGDWYEKYHGQHPAWFALQPDGTRDQPAPERARLCESNREVARQAARRAIEAWTRQPGLASVSISPNDGSRNSYCMCPACRKLDPPNGNPVKLSFHRKPKSFDAFYPSLSDRLVTYYNRVAEEAVARCPEIVLGAYAYDAYRDAPLSTVAHPSIVIGFVGLSYLDEASRRRDLQRWDRWTDKCSRLYLRPNALHAGEGLPAAYTKALAEDIRHCYRTGMVAADFDSLIGNWATQGLNYYVLANLLWDPTLDPDAMVADYCATGFGAAAPRVAAYFKALEEATTQVARFEDPTVEGAIREEEQDEATSKPGRKWKPSEKRYFAIFTPEKTDQLRSLLTQATAAAGGDATIKERIAFLAAGLDYVDHYRTALEHPRQKEVKEAFLEYFTRLFEEQPQALNSAHLLWRASIARIPRLP